MDQPPIADYALIGDCNGAALVSRDGAIDWCCVPRIDSGACFARLLDGERGGHFDVTARGEGAGADGREYLGESLVLQTKLHSVGGEATLVDCFTKTDAVSGGDRRELV